MRTRPLALTAAAITGVLVGAAMVATRAVPGASPATLAFLRYLVGLAFLGAPLLAAGFAARRAPRLPRYTARDAMAIAVLGIFQFGVLIVLLNHALKALPAGICALVFATMPLLTMGLALALRRETLSATKALGILLALCGVALSLGPLAFEPKHAARDWTAAAALVGATLIGAACSVLYRPYLQRYAALTTSALAMAAAVVFLAWLCFATGQPLAPRLGPLQWWCVAFMGLASGLGYFCWLWALGRLEASRVTAFQALGPITAAALEAIGAHRLPSLELCLAIGVVLVGLLLVQRPAAHATAPYI